MDVVRRFCDFLFGCTGFDVHQHAKFQLSTSPRRHRSLISVSQWLERALYNSYKLARYPLDSSSLKDLEKYDKTTNAESMNVPGRTPHIISSFSFQLNPSIFSFKQLHSNHKLKRYHSYNKIQCDKHMR